MCEHTLTQKVEDSFSGFLLNHTFVCKILSDRERSSEPHIWSNWLHLLTLQRVSVHFQLTTMSESEEVTNREMRKDTREKERKTTSKLLITHGSKNTFCKK